MILAKLNTLDIKFNFDVKISELLYTEINVKIYLTNAAISISKCQNTFDT